MKFITSLVLALILAGCNATAVMPPPSLVSVESPVIEPVEAPSPIYPRKALASAVGGWVVVAVDINKDGSISEVKAVDSSNMNLFADAAVKSAKNWKFAAVTDVPAEEFPLTRKYKIEFTLQ
ncbi:TonB family protein [Pseudomaricurvus alkylphenolicus]|uniref:TonB family protein n=1 Tax=Pseudomaricurvus alkylphenolicus TaxID=1306991 RepID=UPI001424A7DA|nr:TonB family protein [Pseudomaricurvus alkylphenolicus]NIB45210.1 TonB family protein [Pseudomaricurvus alkylphenolicus]